MGAPLRCDCGATDCPSCGVAQGTVATCHECGRLTDFPHAAGCAARARAAAAARRARAACYEPHAAETVSDGRDGARLRVVISVAIDIDGLCPSDCADQAAEIEIGRGVNTYDLRRLLKRSDVEVYAVVPVRRLHPEDARLVAELLAATPPSPLPSPPTPPSRSAQGEPRRGEG